MVLFIPDRSLIYHSVNPIGSTSKIKVNTLEKRLRSRNMLFFNQTFMALDDKNVIKRWYVDGGTLQKLENWVTKEGDWVIREFAITQGGLFLYKYRKDRMWVAASKASFNSLYSKEIFISKYDFTFINVGNSNFMIKEIRGTNVVTYYYNTVPLTTKYESVYFKKIDYINEDQDFVYQTDNFIFFINPNVMQTYRLGMKWKPIITTIEETSQILGVVYQDASEDKEEDFRIVYQKGDGTVYNQALAMKPAQITCKTLEQGAKQFLNFKLETHLNEFNMNYIFPPKTRTEIEETDILTMVLTAGIAILLSGVVIFVMCVIHQQQRDQEQAELSGQIGFEDKETKNGLLKEQELAEQPVDEEAAGEE